jgi:hypothetical protein
VSPRKDTLLLSCIIPADAAACHCCCALLAAGHGLQAAVAAALDGGVRFAGNVGVDLEQGAQLVPAEGAHLQQRHMHETWAAQGW